MMRIIDGDVYVSQSDVAVLGEVSDTQIMRLTAQGAFRDSIQRLNGRYWYRLTDMLSWRRSRQK
ncbi:hypothetical protein BLI708_06370 [Bifidobacterium imperatoris]|uniref:DNA-binding protein n=1 Tax=Bifidobacterium imperatoris TaxID=2020965 RepID=A0A2N5IQM0_9BIFI|nr:hypothetical protein [Bifidobacterium imperatoris]PLS24257.1 hypothetical protein Tam1G_1666 [Bifidobacterium imperatoris]QSY56902.1 hypothetical protein BLI708_06370 [Bifidobacterium imperatoris]